MYSQKQCFLQFDFMHFHLPNPNLNSVFVGRHWKISGNPEKAYIVIIAYANGEKNEKLLFWLCKPR